MVVQGYLLSILVQLKEHKMCYQQNIKQVKLYSRAFGTLRNIYAGVFFAKIMSSQKKSSISEKIAITDL